MENKNKNPLLCNPDSGICEILPERQLHTNNNAAIYQTNKSIRILYFTDPICSSCWGIEAQLRKLKLEYGHEIEMEYHMGGLLPDWSYNSGGISKPADVAKHWDEVSEYYQMPIDGDIWLEDPLASSYPPSIAFKAAQLQSKEKAILFLRRLREMVFLEKKNICKKLYLNLAAREVGLDPYVLQTDSEKKALELFEQDLQLCAKYGVRGFPTLIISNANNETRTISGYRDYAAFVSIIHELNPQIKQVNYDSSWQHLFELFPLMSLKEFAELSHLDKKAAFSLLNKLCLAALLEEIPGKNGSVWRKTVTKKD